MYKKTMNVCICENNVLDIEYSKYKGNLKIKKKYLLIVTINLPIRQFILFLIIFICLFAIFNSLQFPPIY